MSVESFLALLFSGHCLQDSDELLGREERLCANLRIQELRARCSQSLTQQHVDAKRLIHGVEMDNHDHGEEIENERPFKFDGECDEVVAKSRQIVSTVNLNAKENDRREGDAESRNYSKTLRKRVRSQESEIAKITRTIHNGGKADFCLAFSLSVSSNRNKRPANQDDGNWDGRLSVDDLTEILKIIQVSKQTNLYESLVKCHSAKQFHINAEKILKMCDTRNAEEDVIKY